MKLFLSIAFLCIYGTTIAQQTPEQELAEALKPLRALSNPLQQQAKEYYLSKDTAGMKKIEPELKKYLQQIDSIERAFLKKYPDEDVSLRIVVRKTTPLIPEVAEPLFNALSSRVKASEAGKKFAEKINAVKATSVGLPAALFTQNDVNGNPVSLASYRGKYVLIDFWASWCVPCRAENPVLKKAYEKYHDKNFDIIAISVDNKEEAWKKAIEQDQLPWKQLSDLKGIHNEVAVKYGVTSVPQNFLVNPHGIIIARNLRGDELEKKLQTLLR